VLAGLCAVSAVVVTFAGLGYPMAPSAAASTPFIANGLNWVKVPQLAVSELVVMPSCLAILRSTSATVTFNITGSRVRMVSTLTILPSVLTPDAPGAPEGPPAEACCTKPFAISPARYASSMESTIPVRMIVSLTVRAVIAAAGIAARRIC
jgi:hypothetical protein